jgi:TatA/E family protein of Tat protein translocase
MVRAMNLNPMAFIQGIGGPELLIILVIILLLFGAKKLPELAKGLGKSMKEFKKATQEVQDDFQEAMDSVDSDKKPSSPPPAEAREKVASEPETAAAPEKKGGN